MFRRILTKIVGDNNTSKSVKSNNAESIFDLSNDELYDTLSIDCSDNIDDMMDSVGDIDMCEDMVEYYDE
ncbi:MAG: hypothetical protein IJZ68_14675 [Bacteroidaceae bacterium]|nr:hypothetical protein [Bacteroidaceae bacterium]MBQ8807654.1 hypothetical protein [Bacteroidaceae bacterium]